MPRWQQQHQTIDITARQSVELIEHQAMMPRWRLVFRLQSRHRPVSE